MRIHADDESFEVYLKQFVPRSPGALPAAAPGRQIRRALALSVSAAIVLLAALFATNWRAKPPHSSAHAAIWNAAQPTSFHPLTIRNANELLARAPSLKAAIDELMLDSQVKTIPESQSALKALSEENATP